MKKSKFTEAQIAFILKQAEDGAPVAEVCRKAGISDATFYGWRKKIRRLDAIGDETAVPARGRVRQAEEDRRRSLPRQGDAARCAFKKALRPDRKRELVDKVRLDWKVSIRRVCAALRIDRALYVYKSKRGGQADLKQRIKEIAETRVRYRYRRIHMLLRREGWAANPKRIYRLYKDLGLQLRHKTPKRRVKAKLRDDRCEAQQHNETWAELA
jgi:putative transposase